VSSILRLRPEGSLSNRRTVKLLSVIKGGKVTEALLLLWKRVSFKGIKGGEKDASQKESKLQVSKVWLYLQQSREMLRGSDEKGLEVGIRR
jgi:hypothetical protein